MSSKSHTVVLSLFKCFMFSFWVYAFIFVFMFFSVDLLSLLQWKEHPEMIQEALNRVLRLNGEELVKFLQDVLDALFSMFSTEDGNSTSHSGLVFHVLVSQ